LDLVAGVRVTIWEDVQSTQDNILNTTCIAYPIKIISIPTGPRPREIITFIEFDIGMDPLLLGFVDGAFAPSQIVTHSLLILEPYFTIIRPFCSS
jgi:hypothetical protein